MRIIGLDPGIARVGWAIVDVTNNRLTAVSYGCITTSKDVAPDKRLEIIFTEVSKLMTQFHPEATSVEDLFFATNVTTAIGVGQSRGVILLASAQHNIPVISYSPLRVKQTICGDGKAAKDQIQRMVTLLLKLPEVPKPDDTADALAIAMTHAYSYKMKEKWT